MEARQPIAPGGHDDDLTQVIARIRARGARLPLPLPSAVAIAAVMDHLTGKVPLSTEELADHERQWHTVEAEMHALEQADGQGARAG